MRNSRSKGLLFFCCLEFEREENKNEKHRRKNFNGRIRNQAVTKQKKKTHRLITRGAILESLIENAEELTDEEIKILLEEATKTKKFRETLKIMREN